MDLNERGVKAPRDKTKPKRALRTPRVLSLRLAKHARATEVSVHISITDDTLDVLIEDNGIGVPADKQSTFGNGLKNMQRRMEDIGGTFELHSKEGEGTALQFKANLRS